MSDPQNEITYQACGCMTTTNPIAYKPCLPCALKNAGLMLQEAGNRMEELAERQRQDDAQEVSDALERANQTMGGSD